MDLRDDSIIPYDSIDISESRDWAASYRLSRVVLLPLYRGQRVDDMGQSF